MNISIPDDLRSRMDAVDQPVNWSAVAADAFERKLAEIISRRGAQDMQDVVNRLRASLKDHEGKEYTAGHEAGEQWANSTAEASELKRLSKFQAKCGRDWDDFFDESMDPNCAYSIQERLFFAINPDADGDRGAASEFAETISGNDGDIGGAWLKGFAEGAIAVWEKVKDQL
jgi:hypothetical protein